MKKSMLLLYTFIFFCVVGIFLLRFGVDVLCPTSTNWLMSAYHDWGQHYLGWAFFREEDWSFPLGRIENYNYPAGTTIGYTDSIPLLAIIFKIFNFLLPKEFQYLGFWLLLSHLLLAYYCVKIFKLYTNNYVYIFLVSLLIAFNPVILYRDIHPALTAHWVFVGIVFYYLNLNKENYKKMLLNQFTLVFISALISPYLVVFSFVLVFFTIIRIVFFDHFITIKRATIYAIFLILVVVIPWYSTGMVSFEKEVNMEVVNSYGLYGLNLNSFFNPESFSNIFPALPKVSPFQYEGYSYLGLGFFLLLVFSLFVYFKDNFYKNEHKKFKLIYIAAILLLLFAITNTITLNDKEIINVWFPSILYKLGGIFRASGRFVWLFYYLLIFSGFIIFLKAKVKSKVKAVFLLIVFAVQLYDTEPFFIKNLPKGRYKNEKLSEERWINFTSNFNRIITYKPFQNHLLNPMDYQDLCFVALKNNLPITMGYVARESTDVNKVFLDSLEIEIKNSNYSPSNIIITTKENLNTFAHSIFYKKLNVKYLDGYYLLYSSEKKIKKAIEQNENEKDVVNVFIEKINKELHYKEIEEPITRDEEIEGNIENTYSTDNYLEIEGWAFKKGESSVSDSIFIALVGDKKTYLFKTVKKERPDLVEYFKSENLISSGFHCKALLQDLEKGKYSIYIGVKDGHKNLLFKNTNNISIAVKNNVIPQEMQLLLGESKEVMLNIEEVSKRSSKIKIKGWAAIENKDSFKNTIQLVLIGKKSYLVEVNYFKREDVTQYFKNKNGNNYDNSGFIVELNKADIPYKEEYQLGILITDEDNNQSFKISDKKLNLK